LETLATEGRALVVTEIVNQLLTQSDAAVQFEWLGELGCRSNLDSKVFREITCLLGMDHAPYGVREQFLDRNLLKNRNAIVHGDPIRIDEETYEQAHEGVLQLLQQFRDDVENAASTQAYRRPVGTAPATTPSV
jgi:hypothetical protein